MFFILFHLDTIIFCISYNLKKFFHFQKNQFFFFLLWLFLFMGKLTKMIFKKSRVPKITLMDIKNPILFFHYLLTPLIIIFTFKIGTKNDQKDDDNQYR